MRIPPITVILTFLLTSCFLGEEREELLVYDLDKDYPEKIIQLDELMSKPDLIRLETTEESLLPEFFNYTVSNKYIVTCDRKRILLFGRDGSFIRQLANQGDGPGEFQGYPSVLIGPNEEKLYLPNVGTQKSILVLKIDGSGFTELEVPGMSPSPYVFINENELFTLGSSVNDFDSYTLNVNNGSLKIKSQNPTEGALAEENLYLASINDEVYLKKEDTLFVKNGDVLVPNAYFKVNRPVEMSKFKNGMAYAIDLLTPNYIIYHKNYFSFNSGEDGAISVDVGEMSYQYVDRKSSTTHEIQNFNYHPDEVNLPRMQVNGSWISFQYQASDWIEIVNQSNALLSDGLKSQSLGMNIEDNPVILIGSLD